MVFVKVVCLDKAREGNEPKAHALVGFLHPPDGGCHDPALLAAADDDFHEHLNVVVVNHAPNFCLRFVAVGCADTHVGVFEDGDENLVHTGLEVFCFLVGEDFPELEFWAFGLAPGEAFED